MGMASAGLPVQGPAPDWLRKGMLALGLAILFRVAFFLFLMVHPLTNELGEAISPLNKTVKSGDLSFYESTSAYFKQASLADVVARYQEVVRQLEKPIHQVNWTLYWLSGPVFPGLLILFDYTDGHSLPLALFYLFLSTVLAAGWLGWLARQGIGLPWLLFFALLPAPVWYMATISTDELFAVVFLLFYLAYFGSGSRGATSRIKVDHSLLVLILLVLMGLLRPNSISIIIFVLLHQAVTRVDHKILCGWQFAFIVVLLGMLGIYYLPYILAALTISTTSSIFIVFGLPQEDYFHPGLLHFLPDSLNTLLSLMVLGLAKTCYFVGLRPSYSGQDLLVVLVRAAPGLVLLPGLLRLLVKGEGAVKLLVLLFYLPVLVGPAQDRYNLPIQPLLFFHGALFWRGLWNDALRLTKVNA
ncbi:MAG: hypothetical protein HQL56_07405 [Magnetococcales bacterium]|nr:hypothetical protein [Magnetococcales bacterium]